MTGLNFSFKALDYGEDVPIGYAYVRCHMIFDVKMDNFRRKSQIVVGVHKTDTPANITYARVVSRDTFCLDLFIAALNDLDVKCVDFLNA